MTRTETTSQHTPPQEFLEWREARWKEIIGPRGKASVTAKTVVAGPEEQKVDGIPGRWRVSEAGHLLVTATKDDGIAVDGTPAEGTVEVPAGQSLSFSGGQVGMVGDAEGSYGLVVLDEQQIARSGLSGIEAYPYEPRWIFHGVFREVEPDRRVLLERLTEPRSTDHMPAPVDLAFTMDGTEHVLTVVEEIPGQGLIVFTDQTSGTETPSIGRWLVVPLAPAGTEARVDLNQVTVSYHHISPSVFTCPLPPAGNHIPLRIEAGERHLLRTTGHSKAATQEHPDKHQTTEGA